ncbi:MAG: hypothetical protein U0930_00215 [Pirellulales bacterium]
MRIGSRRMLWTINCLLLLAAALIFRPIRSWIDQTIIAKSIHPNLSVNEIHLHVNKLEKGLSVVEAKQFDWGSTQGNRHFGISAERAWIVVENAPLLDKNFTIPRAVLEHARLYLNTISTEERLANILGPNDHRSVWQQQLNDRFGEVQWQDLKEHLDGVLRMDQFTKQCRDRIENWIQSTQRISAEAKQLSASTDQLGNPLRDNSELRGRLVKIDQLIASEGKLREDFGKLDSDIESKLGQVSGEFDVHIQMLKDRVAQHKSTTSRNLAKKLVEQTGTKFFEQISPYAEVADLLCRASSVSHGFSANENYIAPDRPVISLDNISATGVFGTINSRSPFRMQSNCQLTSKEPFGVIARTNFRYQFDVQAFTVNVAAFSRLDNQQLTDLQIEVGTLTKSAADPSHDSRSVINLNKAQWVVSSNGNSIVGELYLDQQILPLMAEGNSALSNSVASRISKLDQDAEPLNSVWLELSGTWQSPTWKIEEQSIPKWLLDAIEGQLEQHHRETEQQMIAQLENYVSSSMDNLAADLNKHLDIAKARTSACSEEMLAAKATISKLLVQENATEFARSGQDEVKR